MPQTPNSIPPIGTQLTRLAELAPEESAVTCGSETLTRAELEASANRLARAYADLGVGVGDYVTIVLPNSIEWIQSAFAIWKLGAIPQPLSQRLAESEFNELMDLVPRKLLVGKTDPRGAVAHVPAGFVPHGLSYAPLPEAVSPSVKAMASGGSTGRSKLIETTWDGRFNAAGLGHLIGAQEGDTHILAGPLSHNTPFTMFVVATLMRQHLILMPRFEAEDCLRLITEHRVNFGVTVPTMLQRMLSVLRAKPETFDLSSLRRLWVNAAPCPPAVKKAWIDLVGPDAVWELYGGTELQAMTVLSGTEWLEHPGSVGRVTMGQMKILDEEGRQCPPGTVGEIFMRPAENAGPSYRYIGSTPVVRDGWETIGDLGWFDADGYLYLSDRRVDMFNVGGRKVYPAEIEKELSEHRGVLSCLVVGVPDEDLGQVPYAVIETTEDTDLDETAVLLFLRDRLAPYKIPKTVEFRFAPLRDDAGKARRSVVRDEIIEKLSRGQPHVRND